MAQTCTQKTPLRDIIHSVGSSHDASLLFTQLCLCPPPAGGLTGGLTQLAIASVVPQTRFWSSECRPDGPICSAALHAAMQQCSAAMISECSSSRVRHTRSQLQLMQPHMTWHACQVSCRGAHISAQSGHSHVSCSPYQVVEKEELSYAELWQSIQCCCTWTDGTELILHCACQCLPNMATIWLLHASACYKQIVWYPWDPRLRACKACAFGADLLLL